MSRPVLFAYDGSDDAARAIRTAGTLLDRGPAIVLYVWQGVAALSLPQIHAGGSSETFALIDRAASEHAHEVVERGVAIAKEAGFEAKALVREGPLGTWAAILHSADEQAVCLIVVGARGRSGVKAVVLGSVSTAIAHHSRHPVLIVPPQA